MIDDDADPETLDAWYRRTPDQIAAEQAAKWNAGWNALRTPDDQAYEQDPAPPPSGSEAAPTGDALDTAARTPPPPKNAWANQELGFLDVLASGESNQGDGGYDVLYTPPGRALRHLPAGPDGKPDYSQFPWRLSVATVRCRRTRPRPVRNPLCSIIHVFAPLFLSVAYGRASP